MENYEVAACYLSKPSTPIYDIVLFEKQCNLRLIFFFDSIVIL